MKHITSSASSSVLFFNLSLSLSQQSNSLSFGQHSTPLRGVIGQTPREEEEQNQLELFYFMPQKQRNKFNRGGIEIPFDYHHGSGSHCHMDWWRQIKQCPPRFVIKPQTHPEVERPTAQGYCNLIRRCWRWLTAQLLPRDVIRKPCDHHRRRATSSRTNE